MSAVRTYSPLNSPSKALPVRETVSVAPPPFRHTLDRFWQRAATTARRNLKHHPRLFRMHPLTGIRPLRCNALGYRYSSPRGDSLSFRISTTHPPVPQSILNSEFLILNWTYTFSAKEKDSETGLSYFGSRYYSSDLSIWLSVDPMAAKYPSLSPYVYCADNPVKLTDPDGKWIPGLDEDNNIIVTREEDDDINSFKKFMGSAYSEDEINNMYGQMSQDGSINLTETYGREFQIMTDAINDAYNDPDFEKCENYNCWGAAIAVTKCMKVRGNGPEDIEGVGFHLNSLEQFDNCLSSGYVQGGQESASVGKTVLRFGNNIEKKSHGAVYMGKDRSGTEYVFTKNGWVKRPEISTTERMLFENGYGDNCDRSGNAGQGYYNRKARRR